MSDSLIKKLPAVHVSEFLATATAVSTTVGATQVVSITDVVNSGASVLDIKESVTGGDVAMKVPAATAVSLQVPLRMAAGKKPFASVAGATIGFIVEG